MNFEVKLVKIAENEQKVYEAGQKSMVDESKIIEKTAIGTTTLTIDDVSEIPHDVEVQLDSNLLEMGEDKILFQSGAVTITETSLTSKGNSGSSTHIIFEKKYEAGTYTLSLESESAENRCLVRCYDSSGNIITNVMGDYNAWYKSNIINMDKKKAKFTVPNTVAYWCWGWVPMADVGVVTTITNPKIEVEDGLTNYEGIEVTIFGKNLLNSKCSESVPSNTNASNTSARKFELDSYVLGMAKSNYYNPTRVILNEVGDNYFKFTTQGSIGYGIGFPFKLAPHTTYTVSCYNEDCRAVIGCAYYDDEGKFLLNNQTVDFSSPYKKHTFTTDEYGNVVVVFSNDPLGDCTIANLQLEVNELPTKFEQYIEPIKCSSTATGLFQGIKSVSPNMTFTTDKGIKIEARYHKSWGMQTEWDREWDSRQENGNRTNYNGEFAGSGWTPYTFRPKHDIRPTSALHMFYNATGLAGLDMVERFNEQNIVFDTSKIADFYYAFKMCYAKRWGVIDTTGAKRLTNMLSEGYGYLETVDKIILKNDGSQIVSGLLQYCTALINLIIEGVIGQNGFDLQKSTKLSKASLISVIKALSTTTSGLIVTLSIQAVISAFGSTSNEEWLNLVASKPNWTIALR